MKDFYQVLGIEKTATQDEISKAYRKLAVQWHPDKNLNNPEEASVKFKEVTEAYDVLGDQDKRARYDRFGTTDNNLDFNSAFHSAFRDFGFGGAKRGQDIQVSCPLSLEEAYKGCKKDIPIQLKEKCKNCSGTGGEETEKCSVCGGVGRRTIQQGPFSLQTACPACRGAGHKIIKKCQKCNGNKFVLKEKELVEIEVPAGIYSEQHIKVQNRGIDGGDLYAAISIAEHEYLVRQGDDLAIVLPLSYGQMLLGTKVEIPVFDKTLTLKIPAKTKSGSKFKLKGNGMPRLDMPGTFGDLYVFTEIELPNNPDKEYLKLIEATLDYESKMAYVKRDKILFKAAKQ